MVYIIVTGKHFMLHQFVKYLKNTILFHFVFVYVLFLDFNKKTVLFIFV